MDVICDLIESVSEGFLLTLVFRLYVYLSVFRLIVYFS